LFYRAYGDVNVTDTYSSNNLIPLPNILTTMSGSDPLNNLIYKFYYDKNILAQLNSTYNSLTITYTITLNPGYSTTLYDAKICSDLNGEKSPVTPSV
jgi:hypothetical protein